MPQSLVKAHLEPPAPFQLVKNTIFSKLLVSLTWSQMLFSLTHFTRAALRFDSSIKKTKAVQFFCFTVSVFRVLPLFSSVIFAENRLLQPREFGNP